MAGIIYELMDVLDEEKECYEGLITLAEYKQMAIVNKNMEFLGEVTDREEEFVGRIILLDKKREELMKDISLVMGVGVSELTITDIINKLQQNKQESEKLTKLRDGIRTAVQQVREKNELNKQLIQDSLETVEFMINAIKEQKSGRYVGNYQRGGTNMNIEYGSSMFDTKK